MFSCRCLLLVNLSWISLFNLFSTLSSTAVIRPASMSALFNSASTSSSRDSDVILLISDIYISATSLQIWLMRSASSDRFSLTGIPYSLLLAVTSAIIRLESFPMVELRKWCLLCMFDTLFAMRRRLFSSARRAASTVALMPTMTPCTSNPPNPMVPLIAAPTTIVVIWWNESDEYVWFFIIPADCITMFFLLIVFHNSYRKPISSIIYKYISLVNFLYIKNSDYDWLLIFW